MVRVGKLWRQNKRFAAISENNQINQGIIIENKSLGMFGYCGFG